MAFDYRQSEKSVVYTYEQTAAAALSAQELLAFRKAKLAWAFSEATPPHYKKLVLHWVTTARKVETRASHLAGLLEACAAGRRLRRGQACGNHP